MNAYLTQDKKRISATLCLLKWFKAFIASDYEQANDPINEFGFYFTRPEAKKKLHWLVQMAINRKAGIPDRRGRKDDPDYQIKLYRDQQRLKDIARNIRVYQFETREVKKRFSHLLSNYND